MTTSLPLSSDNELPGYGSTVDQGGVELNLEDQYSDDPDEVYGKASRWFKEWKSHNQDWRKEAIESYDFYSLKQWDEDARTAMEDRMRVPIVIDRTAPVINMVCGLEINNRQQTTYYARNEGAAQQNDLLNGASQWAKESCDAEDEESDAFKDMLICGMGFTETRMNLDDDPEGMIAEDRIDPLQMWWDSSATKKNLQDARFIGRVVKWAKDDVLSTWPDKADDITGDGAPWNDMETTRTEPHDASLAPFYRSDQSVYATDPDEWAVCHIQWKEKEDVVRFTDPLDGKNKFWKPSEFDTYSKKIAVIQQAAGKPPKPLSGFKMKKQTIWQAFICGKTVLEVSKGAGGDKFTFNAMTGYRERNTRTWYGLMRGMKDPQRWSNKIMSEVLYIIGGQSKGGIMIEASAVDDIVDLENKWTDPSGIVVLNDGALSRSQVQERPMGQVAPAFETLYQQAVEGVSASTGLNTAAMGQSTDDNSGYLEYQRRQSAVTILAPFFDALRLFRKQQGRVLLYFIQSYISDNRLIRIQGTSANGGKPQYVKLNRDATLGEYDVIVDDSPYSPNQKERNWAALQQILPLVAQAGVPVPPEMIMELPISSSLQQTWMDYIQKKQNTPPPPPNPEVASKIAVNQSTAQLNQAKTQQIGGDVQSKVQQTQSDAQEASTRSVLNLAQAHDVVQSGHVKRFDTIHNAIMDHKDQQQEDAQHNLAHQNTQLDTLQAHHTVRKDQATLDQGQQALDKPPTTPRNNGKTSN